MSDMPFSLFYAWQSDTNASTGRNFVEEAANKALKEVHVSGLLDSAPRLDKDTKDVPGTPDIINTILDKISMSSAFLADLTFVSNSSEKGGQEKHLPNPNVLLELGYALSQITSDRVICVMNTYYGKSDDLPFDLRGRRRPISFELPDNSSPEEKKSVKKKLVEDLTNAIRQIATLPPRDIPKKMDTRLDALETLVSSLTSLPGSISEMHLMIQHIQKNIVLEEEDKNSPENRVKVELGNLIQQIKKEQFEDIRYLRGMLALVVMPINPLTQKIQMTVQEDLIRSKLRPLGTSGWDHKRHGNSFVVFTRHPEGIDDVSQITDDGIIRSAGHGVISINSFFAKHQGLPEDIHFIPSTAVERDIIEGVQKDIELLDKLEVKGPWCVALSLFNLQKSFLYTNIRFTFDGKELVRDSIDPPSIIIPEAIEQHNPQTIASELRPIFDFIWREYNFPRSLNYDNNGFWRGI